MLQSFILDGIPHKEGGWHIERPCQIQPPTVADGWFVSKQTILTRSNATLSQARSPLTMTQTCYHPPRFRNESRKYYRSNTVYTCNSTANSQSITAIYQPAQQGHSAFSYATCTSFHLPVPWDPRPIEGRNQAHDEEKVSLDRLKDLHGKPNEVVHDEQQTKHLANTWPSCFRPI